MTEKTISYKEIPLYASYAATTNEQIKVVLSKYQAFLFRQKIKMMQHISNKTFIGNAYDTLKFLVVLLAIFISCPRVAFLSDFHGADKKSLERIVFKKYNNKILVIFNPPDQDGDHKKTKGV